MPGELDGGEGGGEREKECVCDREKNTAMNYTLFSAS